MLTVDFDRLGLHPGEAVLDLGSGGGRHACEALRRGAHVVALDLSRTELTTAVNTMAAMSVSGEAPAGALGAAVQADAVALPFPDGAFDLVVAAEVLEHVPDDAGAVAEISRVLRPGGRAAVTVPRWLPERFCWVLSDAYHSNEGGHVRIYRGSELAKMLRRAGLSPSGSHHAHALHSPYWWLRCLAGPANEGAWLPRQYHRLLVWDIVRRPRLLRLLERALNPLLGKSLVIYLERPSALRDAA